VEEGINSSIVFTYALVNAPVVIGAFFIFLEIIYFDMFI